MAQAAEPGDLVAGLVVDRAPIRAQGDGVTPECDQAPSDGLGELVTARMVAVRADLRSHRPGQRFEDPLHDERDGERARRPGVEEGEVRPQDGAFDEPLAVV